MHFQCYCFQICIITSQRLALAALTKCSNIRHQVKGNKIVACSLLESRADALPHTRETSEISFLFIYLVCGSSFRFPSLWATHYQGLYECLGEEERGGDEGRAVLCRIWKCTCSPPSWMIFEAFLHLVCTLTSLHNSFVPHTSVASQFSDESYSCPCSA